MAFVFARRVGVDEIPAGRVHIDPRAEIAERRAAAPVAAECANGDHVGKGGRPAQPPHATVARCRDAHAAPVLAKLPKPLPEGNQREIMPGHARNAQVEDVHSAAQRRFEPRYQVRFQDAARGDGNIAHEDLCAGRHAASHAGGERAVSGVGPDRAGQHLGFMRIRNPSDPGQPRVGIHHTLQDAGVGHVNMHARAAVVVAHRGIGLDIVVDLLGLGGRAVTGRSGCHGQDMIRRRDPHAEPRVDLLERCGHRLEVAQVGEMGNARDNTREGPTLGLLQFVSRPVAQDLQDSLEVVVADQDLTFGVHVADPAVAVGNDFDYLSSAGRLAAALVFRIRVAKGVDYELGLIGDLGL